ncbi:NmrA-like domain [Dillenia turbinata]|uniref:NmrA-like domain n=1 Tax=Dillenia turbinata TaxID=194707 RepID=A0AAN8Z4E1_9MAGN
MSSSCSVSSSVGTEFLNPNGRRLVKPPRIYQHKSKCQMNGRCFAFKGICAASGVSVMDSSLVAQPARGLERLPFKLEGYKFWRWRGHKIHYVEEGKGFPIVLIHGFGASAFHWRYNIPELSKRYKVYAIDLLGFGWSEKAIIEYDAMVWRDQIVDFLNEVVKEPAVLVGNSLGGFTALVSAAGLPEQVVGVALLNTAGQFGDPNSEIDKSEDSILQKFIVKPLKEIFQRMVLGFLFWQAKQPARIESVLKSVYINTSNVDDYLVESITRPADDPNAGEVYYRLMTRFMFNQNKYTLNSVLDQLSCPLLLVWGDLDPWVGPAKANRIKEFYPNTSLVNLQAGHCPHDEVPELVNTALLEWLSTSVVKSPVQTLRWLLGLSGTSGTGDTCNDEARKVKASKILFTADVDRVNVVDPAASMWRINAQFKRTVEAAGIPHPFVVSNRFSDLALYNLVQENATISPREEVVRLGNGEADNIFDKEEDIATTKAVDDL